MDQQLKYIDKIGSNPQKAVKFKDGSKPMKMIHNKRSSISYKQKPAPTNYRAVKFDVYQVGSNKTESRAAHSSNQTHIRENDEANTIKEAVNQGIKTESTDREQVDVQVNNEIGQFRTSLLAESSAPEDIRKSAQDDNKQS